jgi:hypothetical protein
MSTALFSAVAEFAFENVTTSPLSLAITPSAVCSPDWVCLRFARRPTHAERGQAGIALAVDLSARPFYIKGSNHPKGQSFPRLVSDFGLTDAIESGIVKIPRLPVLDATGWPDPKFFRLWERIKERLQPGEPCPKCGKPPRPQRRSRHREARRVPGLAGRWKMGGKCILGPPSSRHPKSKRGFCAEGTRLTPMTPLRYRGRFGRLRHHRGGVAQPARAEES